MSKANMYRNKIRELVDKLKREQQIKYEKYYENRDSFEDCYGQKELIESLTLGKCALSLLNILEAGTDYDLVKAELEKLEINDRTVYIDEERRILIKRIDKKFYKVYIEQLEDVDSGMKHECDLEYLMDLIVKEMKLNNIRRVE